MLTVIPLRRKHKFRVCMQICGFVKCVYVCLVERQRGKRRGETSQCFAVTASALKDATQHCYEDTWNNFCLKLFVQLYEKGQMQ